MPTSSTGMSGAALSALRLALDSSIQAYAQTVVWPRRDVPRRFTWHFFQQSMRAQHVSCCSCVFSYDITHVATKDARRVRCSSCSLGPSPRRPTASCSLAAVRRGDCFRASWLYPFVVQRIDRYSYFCVYLVLLLYQAGSAQLDF